MTAKLIVALRYTDAPAAIDWLCRAFGFEPHLVVPGPDNGIAHAQLTCAGSMIMLGSAADDAFGAVQQPPARNGGLVTQSVYMVVDDADRHYQQACAAGAEIVFDIVDQDYGGRGYTCRDIEGHVWSFGTYEPWLADAAG